MGRILEKLNRLLIGWLGLQYCRPESSSETDKWLVEAADTADVLETMETGVDAM
jgi:hypothetical protein